MVLKVAAHLPPMVANQLDSYTEAFEIFSHIRDPHHFLQLTITAHGSCTLMYVMTLKC